MMSSSKVTNVLLAVIAVCLVAIALRPMGILPSVSAQAAIAAESDTDRFTGITAPSKEAQAQADAIRSVASAIEGLAKSTAEIAKALDGMTRAIGDMGGRMAESQAGTVAVPLTPGAK